MNDFERKLSQQAFRAPPPDLRSQLFDAPPLLMPLPSAVTDRRYSERRYSEMPAPEKCWTWRDWFWPSPLAWGALAALWLVFAVLAMGSRATPAAPETAESAPLSASPTLLSYHTTRDLNDVLALAN